MAARPTPLLSTAVGVLRGRCSEYMLRGPDGTPLRPDVVWFNFGFHSLNENAARPEYGLRNYESAYEADLDRVAGVLTNWSRDLRHEHSPPTTRRCCGAIAAEDDPEGPD